METTITENEQIDAAAIMATTEDKMELYYSRREQLQLLDLQEQSEIDTVLTPEILAKVDNIRAKYKDTKEAVSYELGVLEQEIKADALSRKGTIKSKNVMAVWNKGRVSWDSKLLEGMAKLEPKLLAAKKEGEPTVSIRFNK